MLNLKNFNMGYNTKLVYLKQNFWRHAEIKNYINVLILKQTILQNHIDMYEEAETLRFRKKESKG